MKHLHLLNANVYLTNLLLIPSIVFSYLIVQRIHEWGTEIDTKQANIYANIWVA